MTPDSSFRSTLDFHWKLAVENYCETYHLTFVHPALNKYSQLEEQFNIMDTPNYAGHGPWFMHRRSATIGVNSKNFDGLSGQWDTGAEYVALFPNVLLGVHRDHLFATILTPDGPEKTINKSSIFIQRHTQQL